MIEVYVHTIYYINGTTQYFDGNKPINIKKGGFCYINFSQSGDSTIINTDQVNVIKIKRLILTEEEYEKRRKLLNHEE